MMLQTGFPVNTGLGHEETILDETKLVFQVKIVFRSQLHVFAKQIDLYDMLAKQLGID